MADCRIGTICCRFLAQCETHHRPEQQRHGAVVDPLSSGLGDSGRLVVMEWQLTTPVAAAAVLFACLVGMPMMVLTHGSGSYSFSIRFGFMLYAGLTLFLVFGQLPHVWPVGLTMAVFGIVVYQDRAFWWRSEDTPSLRLRPHQWVWVARAWLALCAAIGLVRVVMAVW